MLAALGVVGIGSAWPDLLVAVVMAVLGLTAAASVLRRANEELRVGRLARLQSTGRFGAR